MIVLKRLTEKYEMLYNLKHSETDKITNILPYLPGEKHKVHHYERRKSQTIVMSGHNLTYLRPILELYQQHPKPTEEQIMNVVENVATTTLAPVIEHGGEGWTVVRSEDRRFFTSSSEEITEENSEQYYEWFRLFILKTITKMIRGPKTLVKLQSWMLQRVARDKK